jgi:hypothetical protein
LRKSLSTPCETPRMVCVLESSPSFPCCQSGFSNCFQNKFQWRGSISQMVRLHSGQTMCLHACLCVHMHIGSCAFRPNDVFACISLRAHESWCECKRRHCERHDFYYCISKCFKQIETRFLGSFQDISPSQTSVQKKIPANLMQMLDFMASHFLVSISF